MPQTLRRHTPPGATAFQCQSPEAPGWSWQLSDAGPPHHAAPLQICKQQLLSLKIKGSPCAAMRGHQEGQSPHSETPTRLRQYPLTSCFMEGPAACSPGSTENVATLCPKLPGRCCSPRALALPVALFSAACKVVRKPKKSYDEAAPSRHSAKITQAVASERWEGEATLLRIF